MMKKTYIFLVFVVALISPLSAQGNIFWEVYLQSASNSPILRKETAAGQEFVVSESDFTSVPSQSRSIIQALEGVKLLFNQCPLSGDVVFRMILNVQGNNFAPIGQIPLFCNITFEGYSNGSKVSVVQFSKSAPFVMSIPRESGLDYLLGASDLTFNDDLLFVYNNGGSFDNTGVSTEKTGTALVVTLEQFGIVAGGLADNLGYPSTVRVDTWSKIKLLFR